MSGAIGSCSCGKVTVAQRHAGGASHLRCHCSKCRGQISETSEYTKEHGQAASADYCCNIKASGPVEYDCTMGTFSLCCCYGMQRGACRECKEPVVGRGVGTMFWMSTIPNTAIMKRAGGGGEAYPDVSANIFYSSRGEGYDEKNGLPTCDGDCCSLLGFFKYFGCGLCSCKSCCCGGTSPSQLLATN